MIKDGNRFIGIELDDKDVYVLGTPEQVRDFEKSMKTPVKNIINY
jgi:hypothetical protein